MMTTGLSASADPAMSVEVQIGGEKLNELVAFLSDQIQRGATRFILTQRGEPAVINDWPLMNGVEIPSLATGIFNTATRDASAIGETVIYTVFAQRGNVGGGQHSFRIEAGHDWFSPKEAPGGVERDVIAMLVRHTEATTRLALAHSRDIVSQHERLLERGMGTYEKLLAEKDRYLDRAHARIEALEARESERIELSDQLRVAASNMDLERAESRRKDREIELRHEEKTKAMQELAPYGKALLALLNPAITQVIGAAMAGAAPGPVPQTPAAISDAASGAPSAPAVPVDAQPQTAPPTPTATVSAPVPATASVATPAIPSEALPTANATASPPLVAPAPGEDDGCKGLVAQFVQSLLPDQLSQLLHLIEPEEREIFSELYAIANRPEPTKASTDVEPSPPSAPSSGEAPAPPSDEELCQLLVADFCRVVSPAKAGRLMALLRPDQLGTLMALYARGQAIQECLAQVEPPEPGGAANVENDNGASVEPDAPLKETPS